MGKMFEWARAKSTGRPSWGVQKIARAWSKNSDREMTVGSGGEKTLRGAGQRRFGRKNHTYVAKTGGGKKRIGKRKGKFHCAFKRLGG